MKKIKRNKLSRAIFLMQKAAQKFPEELTTTSQRQLLEVISKTLWQKFFTISTIFHILCN